MVFGGAAPGLYAGRVCGKYRAPTGCKSGTAGAGLLPGFPGDISKEHGIFFYYTKNLCKRQSFFQGSGRIVVAN